jgi:hypothetical protein
MWNVPTQLSWSPKLGKRMSVFRASARFLVEARSESWEIAEPLKAQNLVKQVGQIKLTVRGVTKQNENSYSVKISIDQPQGPNPQESPLSDYNTLQQSIRLVDTDGRAWQNAGGGGGGNWNHLEYEMTFYNGGGGVPAGEPTKVVWRVPTQLKEMTVPIEFKDLPIP